MSGNRISESTCLAMKLLVTVILALEILNSKFSNCAEMSASAIIVAEPSDVINFENTTSYSVFCVLQKVPPHVNSSHLSIYYKNENNKSENLNETTVVTRINVKENAVCESKSYNCMMSKSGIKRGLKEKSIIVGRPPMVIPPHNFTCISEHQRYIHCQFPAENKCDLNTNYNLTVSMMNECKWWKQGDFIHWDSRNGSCNISMDDSYTNFGLEIRNKVGAKTMRFNVTHKDIVRLDKLNFLNAVHVTATSAKLKWNMSELHLQRNFTYEFPLISENGVGNYVRLVTESRMISSYLVGDLIPHTYYTLEVRVLVVPEILRPSDVHYWSEIGLIKFKTAAHRPITAPTMAPGAYSFKKWSNDLMNVSVFWQSIPDHLHNGTGFEYRVTAVSETGYNFTEKVKISTYTLKNIPIGHYRVHVSSVNDEGESETFNEMQIFPRIDNRQPHIRAVFKAGGYNVSWIAPEKVKPSSYTLMFCNFSSQGTCHDSTHFIAIPAGRTYFVTSQDNALNFAVSANYADNYSSELSWQHCVVAPRTSRLGVPEYHIESVTADSMTVRMIGRCEEHSFYERIEIRIRTLEGQVVWNTSYYNYVKVIDVEGLESSTEYEVIVTAFDGFGKSAKIVTRKFTASKGIWLYISIIIVFGAAAIVFIVIVVIRKLRYVLDIKVDIPARLLEDQDDSVEMSERNDYEEYTNLSCPTIPEETELVTEETLPPNSVSTSEERISVESGETSVKIPATQEGEGRYIEMFSWKQPPIDTNGNYEQMHPSSKQSVIVRSTGYVKMNLFINRARTGNYTQTIV